MLWREFLISWIYADSENLQKRVAIPTGSVCNVTLEARVSRAVVPALEVNVPGKPKTKMENTANTLQSDYSWNEQDKVKYSNLTLLQQVKLLVATFPRFFTSLIFAYCRKCSSTYVS